MSHSLSETLDCYERYQWTIEKWHLYKQTPYTLPIVLVKEHNGEISMCIDYPELNAITVIRPFTMPFVEEMLASLAGPLYFTKLDIMSGYYLIPIAE